VVTDLLEKAGIEPSEVVNLVKYIRDECPHLEFSGLMTIGSAMASHSAQEEQRNPDFDVCPLCERYADDYRR
jgi:uncharacterized pyridoxal phosphate-containing UPF0001 family protein